MRNHTAFSTTTHNRPVLTTTPKPDTYPDGRRRVTMCSARCARNARGARAVDRREQRESSKMMCETSWGVPESARASNLHADGGPVRECYAAPLFVVMLPPLLRGLMVRYDGC